MKTALATKASEPTVPVPWSGFDLINAFNAWKRSGLAGRMFTVDAAGDAEVTVTGLAWRGAVCQQVFEEAAVDLVKALGAFSASRAGPRAGRRAGFPRFKRKGRAAASFGLRNKHPKGGRAAIRVGDGPPRSVTLPGLGTVRVHDDTRPLRRLLAKGRGRVLCATVSRRGGRWWVSLTVDAAELHPARQHPPRADGDHSGWVGVDRGLTAFAVAATADGSEVTGIPAAAPRALAAGMKHQKRLARSVSRKQRGSHNRRKAAGRLGRHHARVTNVRRHFLHQLSNRLVKTHDRHALEDLNIAGMMRNRPLARAISDAGWAEFARILAYKQAWRGGQVIRVDRWYASSKTCSGCRSVKPSLPLSERTFTCDPCGLSLDRDLNAAINLAAWAEQHHAQARDPEARGPVTNACRQDGSGLRTRVGETSLDDARTEPHTATAARGKDAREGRCRTPHPRQLGQALDSRAAVRALGPARRTTVDQQQAPA